MRILKLVLVLGALAGCQGVKRWLDSPVSGGQGAADASRTTAALIAVGF
jgi:hypothetical protein